MNGTTVRGQGPDYCPPGGNVPTGYAPPSPGAKVAHAYDAVSNTDPARVMQAGFRGHVDQCDAYNAAKSGINDAWHEAHNTHTTYFNQNSGVGRGFGGAMSPPYGPGGGNGLMQQPWCPSGYCPGGHGAIGAGNQFNWYPKHGFSYAYERPNDLVYPPAGGIGGAVVYPYYTHKGPSDFFRKN